MTRYRQVCITHIDVSSKYSRFFAAFLLFSCSFSSLYATEDPYPTSPLAYAHTAFPSAFSSRIPEHEGTLIREFAAGDTGKVWLVYSEREHKILGFVANKEGHAVPVKSHDMPRELAQIRNAALFEAFCQNTYVHTRFLSNGDMSFSLHQRGLGGGKLHEAAERGDIKSLNTLLANPDARSQMNERNDSGLPPLHCAVASGQLGAVQLLLDSGANLYQAGARGMTALHLSVQVQAKEICRLLLSRGAPTEALDEEGRTALDLAAEMNAVEMRQLLQEYEKREIDSLISLKNPIDARRKSFIKRACVGGALTASCLGAIGGGLVYYFTHKKKEKCANQLNLAALSGRNGFRLPGVAAENHLCLLSSGMGDINGDSIDDIIIGAPYANNNIGASYVVFGHSGVWPTTFLLSSLDGTNGFTLNGVTVGDEAGLWTSGIGDINGDNIDDLIIGTLGINNTAHDPQRMRVTPRRNSTLSFLESSPMSLCLPVTSVS